MLKLNHIRKSYGKKLILDDVSVEFRNPEGVYGLLGRNGAGKTTLMHIIGSQIVNYRGTVELDGKIVLGNDELMDRILVIGDSWSRTNGLLNGKIKRVLDLFEDLYDSFDREWAEDLMDRFHLNSREKVSAQSTGRTTLFKNLLGLASRRPITVLDEPTNGLDSVNRRIFFEAMMEDYLANPRLYLISTHLINEVENYLTDVLILHDGKMLVDDSLEAVQSRAYRITNAEAKGKRVVGRGHLGPLQVQDIYDELTTEEIGNILSQGGSVESLDLQTLFTDLVGEDDNHE